MRYQTITIVVGLVALLVSCGTVPKPQELLDLEQLREGKQYQEAEAEQGELIGEGDAAYKKAIGSWEDEELDQSKHWALLASIKVRTALTIIAQEGAKQRITLAKKKLGEMKAIHAQLMEKDRETDEQLRLHDEIKAARKSAATKEAALKKKEASLKQKLTQAQKEKEQQAKLAAAQKVISDAAVALKKAETVQAATHAKGIYGVAAALLPRAQEAHKEGKASEANSIATAAKAKAEAAYTAALPLYLKARKGAEQQTKNQALQKAAAGVPGVTMRMKTLGQTQQLILPIPNLFKRSKTTPRAQKMAILNSIGALLKKYPGYPVIVNGYTSYRVRRSKRYVVAQARAQTVANHFVAMGVPFKRMGITGRGVEQMIAAKYSGLNNRVEVIILFQ
jgi:outer membrane protein OmpA-like peptidoglycan-associated protein